MKYSELQNMSSDELQQKLKALKEQLHKLNLQRYSGAVDKPHMFSAVRRDISRVLMLLNSKKE